MIPSGDSFLLWRGHSARREMDERPSRRAPASCWSRVFCALVLIHLCPIAAAGREVVLLYTGATKSFLEAWSSEGSAPTGSGRVGGLARRATLVRDLRRGHPNALLVDAGGLFDGDSDLDRLRCSTHLRAVSAMGYDAVNVGADELRYGRAFLEAEWDSSGVAFTSANLVGVGDAKTLVPAYRVLETGGVRIGFIGVAGRETASAVTTTSGPVGGAREHGGMLNRKPGAVLSSLLPDLQTDTDLVVVLSDLSEEGNREIARQVPGISVIIGGQNRVVSERVGNTLILGTVSRGRAVGRAVLSVEDRLVSGHRVEQVYLTEEIAEDPQVARLVEGLYGSIRSNPRIQVAPRPGFGHFDLERSLAGGENGYTGAATCLGCHPAEYADWRATGHAGAIDLLLETQKHTHQDCVACHTTGYGYPSGFQVGDRTGRLDGVGCETCHGPGRLHVRRPERGNTRGEVPVDLCAACHAAEGTPGFEAWAVEHFPRVAHGGPGNGQGPSGEGGGGGRVKVELFVMPHCPYGIEAEESLVPVIKAFGQSIDFGLYFIAAEEDDSIYTAMDIPRSQTRSGPSCVGEPEGTGRFRSLHGDGEVAEGMRQTAIMALYPDRFHGYLLCRNKTIDSEEWEGCAAAAGMDPERIAELASGPEGEALYRRNIRRADLLGIDASPTLRVNGRDVETVFDPDAVARRICRVGGDTVACEAVPTCSRDVDCIRPGWVGVCTEPGRSTARCQYTDPLPFDVTVLNDLDCDVCETGYFIRSTLELFPGARFRTYDIASAEGESLAVRYGIDRVPAFVLHWGFERTARFARFEGGVRRTADAHLPDPRMIPITQLIGRMVEPGRLDLFLGPPYRSSAQYADELITSLRRAGAPDRIRVYHLDGGEARHEREGLWFSCVQQLAPDRFRDYLVCWGRESGADGPAATRELCLERAGLEAEAVERCAAGPEGAALLQAELEAAAAAGLDPSMAPAVVLDNRVVVTAGAVGRIRELYSRLHPEAVAEDRNRERKHGP